MVCSIVKYNFIESFIERLIESRWDYWGATVGFLGWTVQGQELDLSWLSWWLPSNSAYSMAPWSCEKDKAQCAHTVTESILESRVSQVMPRLCWTAWDAEPGSSGSNSQWHKWHVKVTKSHTSPWLHWWHCSLIKAWPSWRWVASYLHCWHLLKGRVSG